MDTRLDRALDVSAVVEKLKLNQYKMRRRISALESKQHITEDREGRVMTVNAGILLGLLISLHFFVILLIWITSYRFNTLVDKIEHSWGTLTRYQYYCKSPRKYLKNKLHKFHTKLICSELISKILKNTTQKSISPWQKGAIKND